MAIFQAFRALRPVPDKAEAVAALPYDVVTREEAKEIGDQNPDSFHQYGEEWNFGSGRSTVLLHL